MPYCKVMWSWQLPRPRRRSASDRRGATQAHRRGQGPTRWVNLRFRAPATSHRL